MTSVKYEVVDNHRNTPQKLGTVSWDGSELVFSPAHLERRFWGIDIHVGNRVLTLDDGLDFIRAIPHHYRSGYISLRRVE